MAKSVQIAIGDSKEISQFKNLKLLQKNLKMGGRVYMHHRQEIISRGILS